MSLKTGLVALCLFMSSGAFAGLNIAVTRESSGTPDGATTNTTCNLDANTTNNIVCTNDAVRYKVAYQVTPPPVNQSNVQIVLTIPATEQFRIGSASPGVASCTNAAPVSNQGRTLTCVLRGLTPNPAGGPIATQSADIFFDVLTNRTAQNGSVLTGLTGTITSTENPVGATSVGPGVSVVAEPRLDIYKRYAALESGAAPPAGCPNPAANTSGLGANFRFFIGLDIAAPTTGTITPNTDRRKGIEPLADSWTYQDNLTSISPNACIVDARNYNVITGQNPYPPQGVANPEGLNVGGGTYAVSGTTGLVTITAGSGVNAPNTSGDITVNLAGGANTVAPHEIRVWIPLNELQAADTCSYSGTNTVSAFDPNGTSGASNFGAGIEPLTNNTVAFGPINLCSGAFEKLYTWNTKGVSRNLFQQSPRMDNEFIGANDFVDSYVYWINQSVQNARQSICDKWDNRRKQIDLLDPALHGSGYGSSLGAGSNYQYQNVPAALPMVGDTSAAYSHIWISSSQLTRGPTAQPNGELEFGFLAFSTGTSVDEDLRSRTCNNGDSTLSAVAALGNAGAVPPAAIAAIAANGWVTQSALKANPSLVPYVNAVRLMDANAPAGALMQIFTHYRALQNNPFPPNNTWPDGAIIPNYGAYQTSLPGAQFVNSQVGTNNWANATLAHMGNDPLATVTCTSNPQPEGEFCDDGFSARLRLQTEAVGVRKGVSGTDPTGGPISDSPAVPKNKGDIVRYQIWPSLSANSPSVSITNDLILEDTLPAGLAFIPGSVTFNGSPVSAANLFVQDGSATFTTSTIKVRVPNQIATFAGGTIPPVEFDAEIILDDPTNAAPVTRVNRVVISACQPGASINATTGVVTCNNQTPGQTVLERTSTRTVQLAASGALIVQKQVVGPTRLQVGSAFTKRLRYINAGSSDISEHRLIDILPYNGEPNRGFPLASTDFTNFSGTRPISAITTPTGAYTVFYTTDAPAGIDASPKCASNLGAGPGAWQVGTVGVPATGCAAVLTTWLAATGAAPTFTVPANATAIMIIDKVNFPDGDPSRKVDFTFSTPGSRHDDRYSNNVSAAHGDSSGGGATFNVFSNDVTVRVFASSLRGTVFLDPDGDGATTGFEAGTDTPISGVTVTLTGGSSPVIALTATAVIPAGQYYNPATGLAEATSSATNCLVPTGGLQIGQYLFCNLLPGNYTVTESQPAGYVTTGNIAGNASTPGTVAGDVISGITLGSDQNAVGYDFGEAESLDFGDLPDSAAGTGTNNYNTLATDNGARHGIRAGLSIGASVDQETTGAPSASANGDDTTGADDEDAFAAAPQINAGSAPSFNVPMSNSGAVAAGLCGFLDLNNDGDFADAGETSFVSVPAGATTAAPRQLVFPNAIPVNASSSNVYLRLRLSSDYTALASCTTDAGAGQPAGAAGANDGEVEDYQANIVQSAAACPVGSALYTFAGDDWPTSLVPSGDTGLFPGAGATQSITGPNGPVVLTLLATPSIPNTTTYQGAYFFDSFTLSPNKPVYGQGITALSPAAVNTTFNFDRSISNLSVTWADVDFQPPGAERLTVSVPATGWTVAPAPGASSAYTAGATNIVPTTALVGCDDWNSSACDVSFTRTAALTSAQFAYDVTASNVNANNYLRKITFCAPPPVDFGDLPDTGAGASTGNYSTLLADNGARHNIVSGFNMGTLNDGEDDGFPGTPANGDDNNASDDEDAFSAPITGTAGTTLSLPSFNVNNGTGATAGVCAFFDGNRDGDFADANERVFVTVPAASGAVTLPSGLIPAAASGNGANYLRVRLSTDYTSIASCDADLGVGLPNGGATDNGEVEDYPVAVSATTDIGVDKDDGQTTYTPGSSLNYLITISNNGSQGANGVTMTDVFPIAPYNQFARVDWSVLESSGPDAVCLAGCAGSATSIPPGNITQSGIFASFNLAPGGFVTLQVQAITVNPALPATAATITNTATLGFPTGVTDTVPTNNTDDDVDTVAGTIGTGTTRPICGLPGANGGQTIGGANTVVNTYYTLPAGTSMPAPGGSRCVPIDVASAIPTALAPVVGDLLLIVQMQDGTFNPTNSTSGATSGFYGASVGDGSGFTALENAGLYEYALVTEAVGTGGCVANQVKVRAGGAGFGLINSYAHTPLATTNRETVQIVRVPQYTDLTLTGAGSIDAAPWDGLRGGVTVIDVRDTLALNGTAGDKVCANGDGFRGGGAYAAPTSGGTGSSSSYAGTVAGAVTGGVKAEGIVGTPRYVYNGSATLDLGAANEGYAGGALRRGGPGNAGGGGNACTVGSNTDRTGGGGGSNGQVGGLGGNPAGTCTGTLGGIRGGVIQPLNPLRATAGGGGGSGASDAASGSEGGRGGGSVFVRAGTVTGIGAFCARGSAGNAGTGLNGAGGGGAGGTVLLLINVANTVPAGLSIDVRGGNGGASPSAGGGAGGGGGRGFVSQFTGASVGFTGDGGTQGSGAGSNNAQSGTGASLQTGLNPYNVTPGPKPGFLCSNGTVPVTLSKVAVSQEGSEMVVRFNTASEAGTLGYRVLADVGPSASFSRTELGYVDSKSIDSLKEQSYELRSRSIGASQIWIEEQSITGKAELYGPYAVGKTVGESNLAPAMNWSAVNAEQQSFRTNQQVNLRGQSTGRAEVSVSADGWISFSGAELAAAGLTGSDIAVSQGSRSVASKIERSGGSITSLGFYGRAVSGSIYTKTAVYSLSSGSASAIAMQNAVATSGASAVLSDLIFDQNALYSFTAPSDPWFNFRALRNVSGTSNGGSSSFTLSDYAGAGAERLMLSYWGGSSYSGAGNDHSVQFLLNGQVIGSDRFDGFASRTLDLAIPSGALRAGQNTLSVQMVNDTGFASDIVNVESYTLRYRRNLVASGNRLNVAIRAIEGSDSFANGFEDGQVATGGPSSYTISNLTAPAVVLLERAGAQSLLATSTGASVSVQFDAQVGDRLIVSPVQSTLNLTAASSAVDPIGSTPATYLIISHPSFIGGLSSFVTAKQQQGFTVKVVDVEALYRYYNAGVVDPAAISLAIKNAQKLGVTNVLLIGGDTYDYLNVLGINSVSFVPTNYRRTDAIVNFAPADSVYADTDNNGAPNVALGRWPVRTQAELQAVIAKTLSYQNSRKAVLVNDRALNGERYSQVAAPFAALLPQDWSRSLVDLDSYTDTAIARTEIVTLLGQGANLLSYYGHSAPASWSREGLITASQLSNGLLNSVNQSFVTVQLGCWGTYFVEPTSTTVAHQLLLMPKGAAAVLGASTLTQTNSDKLFAGYVLPNFGSQSIGSTLKGALEAMSQEADANDVTVGGTLLGDPSLR